MKYAGYEIAQVAIVDFGNGPETIKITDPDQIGDLEDDVIDSFFTLFGCYRDGKSLLTDDLFDSADFDRVLQVYSRITGNEAKLSPPSGHLIKLPS